VTQQPRGSGSNPVADFQRWLVRSGVRSMTREVGDQLRGLVGGGGSSGDVWERATAPPPQEAPECAWCPICRAARLLRESRPGLASHMAAAGDTLASVVAEAVSTVESALAAAQRAAAENAQAAAPEGPREATGDWQAAVAEDWPAASPEDGRETGPKPGESGPRPGGTGPKPGGTGPKPGAGAGEDAAAGQDRGDEPAAPPAAEGSPDEPDHRG
jgi:hypothetical protein